MNHVGMKIEYYRKEKNISRAALSEKSGISEISIRKYESGERNPKIETLNKIAIALGVPLSDLLGDEASIDVTSDDKEAIEFLDGFTFDNSEIFDVIKLLKGFDYIIEAKPYEDTHLIKIYNKDNELLVTVKKADFEKEAEPLIKLANMVKNRADSFVDSLDFLCGFHNKQ